MSAPLEFKGYRGSSEYNALAKVFEGRILGIKDYCPYVSPTTNGLRAEFRKAVNDYLEMCQFHGIVPEKPDYQNQT